MIATLISCNKNLDNKLVGKWIDEENGEIATIVKEENKYFFKISHYKLPMKIKDSLLEINGANNKIIELKYNKNNNKIIIENKELVKLKNSDFYKLFGNWKKIQNSKWTDSLINIKINNGRVVLRSGKIEKNKFIDGKSFFGPITKSKDYYIGRFKPSSKLKKMLKIKHSFMGIPNDPTYKLKLLSKDTLLILVNKNVIKFVK